jgi:hypothetical protein
LGGLQGLKMGCVMAENGDVLLDSMDYDQDDNQQWL